MYAEKIQKKTASHPSSLRNWCCSSTKLEQRYLQVDELWKFHNPCVFIVYVVVVCKNQLPQLHSLHLADTLMANSRDANFHWKGKIRAASFNTIMGRASLLNWKVKYLFRPPIDNVSDDERVRTKNKVDISNSGKLMNLLICRPSLELFHCQAVSSGN